MSKAKIIRVYDYVNHPYEEVKNALTGETATVFRNATKVAAERAQSVASELRVNLAGIDVGTEIDISVESVEEIPKKPLATPMTRINLNWEASKMPGLFPFMKRLENSFV